MVRPNSRSYQFGLRIPLPILRRIDELVAEAKQRDLPNVSRSEIVCAILSRHMRLEAPRPEVLSEDAT